MAYRKEKLEELIKRVVSELILKEIKDPRIGFMTVTGVTLSRDYSVAEIGISVLGSPVEEKKTLAGIKSATGYIQHRVGKAVRMRTTPRIEFYLDTSVSDGVRMVSLLNDLESQRSDNDHEEDEPGTGNGDTEQ